MHHPLVIQAMLVAGLERFGYRVAAPEPLLVVVKVMAYALERVLALELLVSERGVLSNLIFRQLPEQVL